MKKYLHIGCGENILPKPFLNLDIRKTGGGVDYIGLAYPLKFKKNSFDLVYASHVLEHFKKKDTLNVLKEWVRVLKPNGILRISVPCFDNLIKIYKSDNAIENIAGPLFGGQTYKQNFHYNLFNYKNLTEYLNKSGCVAVHPWDFRRTVHSNYWDFSQATTKEIPISLNLEARKKSISSKDYYLDDLNNLKSNLKYFKKKLPKKIFSKIVSDYNSK
jgi:predicted SAM-dependent methyltransferase